MMILEQILMKNFFSNSMECEDKKAFLMLKPDETFCFIQFFQLESLERFWPEAEEYSIKG